MKGLKIKTLYIAALMPVITACGTLSTVPKTNSEVRNSLMNQGTNCSSLSRVYSGVAYGFCTLHSDPKRSSIEIANANDLLLAFYGIDMVVSAVADTLLLPYTITQQNQRGTIDIQ